MEYRNLGRSGLKVSLAGLGCNNFGMLIDEPASEAVVHAALDQGINFFDTANIYGGGKSEEFLGRALGKRRHEAIVASKFGVPTGRGPNERGASRHHVLRAAEDSLRRLGSDYLDVYLVHFPDPGTPIEETLDAMNRLVERGHVRYLGCSNFAGWQIADAHWEARSRGLRGFVTAQNEWSLLRRGFEAEGEPACRRFGLGVLPYFPLASGVLTGKYRRGRDFDEDSRLRRMKGPWNDYASDANLTRVERLAGVAERHGLTLLELALSWLASHPVVSSVMAGATRPEQVKANAAATRGELAPKVLEEVEQALGADA